MFFRKCVRAGLSILMALFVMVLAACKDSSAVVTKRDGGAVSYPFNAGGFLTAVAWGDREAVKAFLERGLDVNVTDADGNSGLHAAADKKDSQMVRFLIDSGADLNLQNNRGYTALMLAAANKEPDMLTLLLEAGADPSLRNEAGETAADIAEDLGHKEVIGLLLADTEP